MSSSKGTTSGVKSSFEAFAKVEEVVSKPILGSDGAASWQQFRKDYQQKTSQHRPSTAPMAPLKKNDRLGTGFTSWEEERTNEDKVRQETGQAALGSGYTTFRKKNSAEEAAERKRIKQIEARIRPDDKDYYIPADTFQGWKFDYVFTTREGRGTGYYWDGSDSIKKLRGELSEEDANATIFKPINNTDSSKTETEEDGDAGVNAPKKKKRKKNGAPVIVTDPTNPREQIAALIEKRQQALHATTDPTLPPGWEAARDPSSGKVYYFNRSTNERSWAKPDSPKSTTAVADESATTEGLPVGWQAAVDATSGKTYYYHENGETSWKKPS